MKIRYARTARQQLGSLRAYIAKDNPAAARSYLQRLHHRLESMLQYPYIGKVNSVNQREDIRETVVEGFKVIYLVGKRTVTILAIYKHIDFDENQLDL